MFVVATNRLHAKLSRHLQSVTSFERILHHHRASESQDPQTGIDSKKSKGYSPVSDFEAHLNAYETFETTCAERKQRVTATTHSETRLFHQRQNPDGILSERSKTEWRWGFTNNSKQQIESDYFFPIFEIRIRGENPCIRASSRYLHQGVVCLPPYSVQYVNV